MNKRRAGGLEAWYAGHGPDPTSQEEEEEGHNKRDSGVLCDNDPTIEEGRIIRA